MLATAPPRTVRLKSQPLKIAACPACGKEAELDYDDTWKWWATCRHCGRFVNRYAFPDTCLRAFLDLTGEIYARDK